MMRINLVQCPPFRLGYFGLGEPLCFAAFGPFATTAFYLLQSGTRLFWLFHFIYLFIFLVSSSGRKKNSVFSELNSASIDRELMISGTIVASSVLVGLTTSLILFCSHFHQIEDDKAVGKFSPLVRLGPETGSKVLRASVVTLYSLVLILGLAQVLPFSSIILCALTLPIGNLVVSFVKENHKDNAKIFMAKYYCVRLHTIFGLALAAGLVAARMFARKQLPHAVLLHS